MTKRPKIHILFYISLVYTLIPLFNVSNYMLPAIVVIILTILFIGAYLGTLVTEKTWQRNMYWWYMILYIVIFTYQNLFMAMFIAYVTNLFSWYYDEPLYSKRSISIWVLALVNMWLVSLSTIDVVNKIVVAVVTIFSLGLMVTFYQANQQEKLKTKLYEKNESINLLLAENERNRISRDLHDSLGHIFALLTIKSELTLALLAQQNYDALQKELQDIKQVSQQSMKEVRLIVEKLKQYSIEDELRILNDMLHLAEIDVTIKAIDFSFMPLDVQKQIALLLREFSNNIIKHSQSTHCTIIFEKLDNDFTITIEDNGIGFANDTITLRSIEQRVVAMNGIVTIQSIKQPTIVIVSIPLENNDENFISR